MLIVALSASKTSEKGNKYTHSELLREAHSFNSMVSGIKSIEMSEIGQGPVSASVSYVKEKGFKLVQSTMGREEMILSADQSELWFWSRSFDPNSAYYCDREKVYNTRLREELYPCVVIGILCVDSIPLERATIVNRPSGPAIMTVEEGLVREMEFMDGRIVSQTFYSGPTPIVSVRFTEFQKASGFTLPKKASVLWHEKARRVSINFGKADINAVDDVDTSIPQRLSRVSLEGF